MEHTITGFITAIVTFIATALLCAMLSAEARKTEVKAGVTIVGDKAYRLVPVETAATR